MASTATITTESARETQEFGASIGLSLLKEGNTPLICCYGELGSGKTTFVQGLANGLGIRERLISPTFIIVRRYRIPAKTGFLFHVDAYRVNNAKEADTFGYHDIIREPDSVVVIEWPERILSELPQKRMDIYFQTEEDGRHTIRMEKHI